VLENSNGKLLVYASALASHEKRMRSLRSAAERMAKLLRLSVEVVTFSEEFEPMYVYYKNGDEEPIPIYCDYGGKAHAQEICVALRNMMFVLSFHPRHSALRQIRKEIMRFS
jgi:hypothetical protein